MCGEVRGWACVCGVRRGGRQTGIHGGANSTAAPDPFPGAPAQVEFLIRESVITVLTNTDLNLWITHHLHSQALAEVNDLSTRPFLFHLAWLPSCASVFRCVRLDYFPSLIWRFSPTSRRARLRRAIAMHAVITVTRYALPLHNRCACLYTTVPHGATHL